MFIKKFALVFLSLNLGASAFAASTTTNTANTSSSSLIGHYQKLKDSPLSFTILSDNYSGRGKKSKYMDRFTSANYTYLSYKFSKKDKVTLNNTWVTNRVKQVDGKSFASDTTFNRIQLSYKRYGLLNQKDHGVNLSSTVAFRIHPDKNYRNPKNRYGQQSISFSMDRSFKSGFSISSYSAYVKRNVKDRKRDHTRSYLRQIITPSYSFSDKLSASIQFDYLHYFTRTTNEGSTPLLQKEIDMVDVSPAIQYTFNKFVSGEIYAIFSPITSYDGQILQEDWLKYPTIGADFTLSMF